MTETPLAPRPTAPQFSEIRATFTPEQEKAFQKLTPAQKAELRKQGLMWGLIAADAAPGGTQSLMQVFLDAAAKGLLSGTSAATAALKRLIRQSSWGQKYTSTQEEMLAAKYQFPEEYDNAINGTSITIGGKTTRTPGWVEVVRNMAAANGAKITDAEAIELADIIIMNRYDETQAERIVLGYVDYEQADLLGKAGQYQDTIDSYARNYGFKLNPKQQSTYIQDLIFGKTTENDILDKFKRDAAKQYTNFSDRIMGGETVEDVLTPYKTLANKLLEVPDVSLDDNLMIDVLSGKTKEGTAKYASLSDFKRAIKSDPRWQQTDNARSEYFNVGQRILQDFGFLG